MSLNIQKKRINIDYRRRNGVFQTHKSFFI